MFPLQEIGQVPIYCSTYGLQNTAHLILEFASPVWDPYLEKKIQQIERIPWLSARFILGNY